MATKAKGRKHRGQEKLHVQKKEHQKHLPRFDSTYLVSIYFTSTAVSINLSTCLRIFRYVEKGSCLLATGMIEDMPSLPLQPPEPSTPPLQSSSKNLILCLSGSKFLWLRYPLLHVLDQSESLQTLLYSYSCTRRSFSIGEELFTGEMDPHFYSHPQYSHFLFHLPASCMNAIARD